MSVPLRDPVFVTVNRTRSVPVRDTLGAAVMPLSANDVYDRPYPNGYSGL